MPQPAPTRGKEIVFPTAMTALAEFAEDARPELEFALSSTITRLHARVEAGSRKYGTMLMTENGRDAVQDTWEEVADGVFYIEQAMLERGPLGITPLFEVADLLREALLRLTEWQIAEREGIVASLGR